MKRRTLVLGAVGVVLLGIAALVTRPAWMPMGAVAQSSPSQQPRPIPVLAASAVKKKIPVQVEALGAVTPIASVAIRSRLDNEIVAVHFADGAFVKKGDLLLTLDSRALEAQVAQAEGTVARDQAQLDGAARDVRRYTDLVAKNATPVINLDNAKTQVDTFKAAIKADTAALENLKVQLTYCTIRAPITGRISAASVKVGNFVRSADVAPIATIIQMAPVYVTFTVPQGLLPDIRQALKGESATVVATIPGTAIGANGAVTMIENTVDMTTGMAMIRATMPNEGDVLWPGTLVNTQLTLREEEGIAVPSTALQVSQQGTFVFVIADGVAKVRPVKVARAVGTETVIESGVEDGEVVVTDGHLLLTNNARVTVREPKAAT
jgi:multidrug efflux system membrane fusion protein